MIAVPSALSGLDREVGGVAGCTRPRVLWVLHTKVKEGVTANPICPGLCLVEVLVVEEEGGMLRVLIPSFCFLDDFIE